MRAGEGSTRLHLDLLLELDRLRARSALARPTAATLAAAVVPILLLLPGLWMLGRAGSLTATGASAGLTTGLLVAGPLAFLGYGVLFRAADDGFLRRLGIDGEALYRERCLRLALAAAIVLGALLVPFAAAGEPLLPPLALGGAAAGSAVAAAAIAFALAARATVSESSSTSLGIGIRQFDPELARAAPLVYAPLLPLLGGTAGGAAAGGAGGSGWLAAVASLVLAGGAILVGSRVFGQAAARFYPIAQEMSYSPPPEGEGELFRVGRGLSALLPRRAGAVWVRDATVAGRRFPWAARVTWPIVLVSVVALARWGDRSATHVWVLAAVGLAILVQSSAVAGLGRLERSGPGWLDRSSGVPTWERFLGRWAWAWGLSLWLLVPVALAWMWWSGREGAWLWPLAGAGAAIASVSISLAFSGRR